MTFIILTQIKGGDQYDEDSNSYTEKTVPTLINVETISRAYPRNDNKPGTRITFSDGGGFAVTELFDHLLVAVGAASPEETTRWMRRLEHHNDLDVLDDNDAQRHAGNPSLNAQE
jgi:hypothetical protein